MKNEKRSVMWFLWKEGKSIKRYFVKSQKFIGTIARPNPLFTCELKVEDGWSKCVGYEHTGRPYSTGYQGNIVLISCTIDTDLLSDS